MGILSRFTSLMKTNINHIIDQSKSPEKEIKKLLRDLTLNLRTLNAETNAAEAEERRASRAVQSIEAEINKLQRYIERAAENGDETQANAFLDERLHLESKKPGLIERYNKAAIELKEMQLLEEKMTIDVNQLEKRSSELLNRLSAAERQNKINEIKFSSASSGFSSYEEEIQFKLDEANALAELRESSVDRQEALSIDKEIAALQKKDNNSN